MSPALGCKYKIADDIGPEASATEVLDATGWPASRRPVMVIGNQLWLGELAALLLTGEERCCSIKMSQRTRSLPDTSFATQLRAPCAMQTPGRRRQRYRP